jgi:excisionase family DNA binding protein
VSIDGSTTPAVQILLSPREAARALSISPRLLWQLTHDGKIVATRLGRSVRYSVASLQALVAAHTSQPGAGGTGE